MKWRHTLGGILADNWTLVRNNNLNGHQLKHLNQISRCHTPSLGGTVNECLECSELSYTYNSCRNRHCPSCGGSKRDQWIQRQQSYLLDTAYYHVVFTMPKELNTLSMYAPRIMYDTLFTASWKTIQTFASDRKYLGAQTGMTAVLHTWSQNMGMHPHLHCIVPGGGITKHGKWKYTRSKGKYLFPVKAMTAVYKGIFMAELKRLAKIGAIDLPSQLRESLYKKRWVVYAKRPFAKPDHVIEYLGRYTHKVAISNHRLLHYDTQHVLFKWKDYRNSAKTGVMQLDTSEFIRRLSMHILPHKFVRIRHYGLLSFHARSKTIPKIQTAQNYTPEIAPVYNLPVRIIQCHKCKSQNLQSSPLHPTKTRSP